ncbi:MAG: hypothetical protein AABY05_03615 [Nanoarchaeota archaeon]
MSGYNKSYDFRLAMASLVVTGLAFGLAAELGRQKIIKDENDRYRIVLNAISLLDGEPGTSDKDWALAYRDALGKNYDPRIDDSRELNAGQLDQIRNRYSEKLESVIDSDNSY